MNFIVSVDENWGIGNKGRLLARVSEDQKFFRRTTMGHVVVLGRKTLDEFPGGKPLKGRTNIILSTDSNYFVEGAIVAHSIDELRDILVKYSSDDIFIIGGQSVYSMMIKYCKYAYITKFHNSFEADAHILNLDKTKGWSPSKKLGSGVDKGMEYDFWLYENENTYIFC